MSLNFKNKYFNSSEVVEKLEKKERNVIQFCIGRTSNDLDQKSPWLVQAKYV